MRFIDGDLELRDADGALQVGYAAAAPAKATTGATPRPTGTRPATPTRTAR